MIFIMGPWWVWWLLLGCVIVALFLPADYWN